MANKPFLIFDAYGTLVELDDFYGRLQSGFARTGLTLPLDVVQRAAHIEMKHYIERSVEARDPESWRRLRLECAAVLADAVRAQSERFSGRFSISLERTARILGDAVHFRAFPETRSILKRLQQAQIPMGVLSNWDYELPHIFDSMKLGKFFSFIISSAEIGKPKPASEVFQSALERAQALYPGLQPEDCYYIGDHFEKDVLPAQAAGFKPLWLVRSERDLPSGPLYAAGQEVQRLHTLQDLLRVLHISHGDSI